MKTIDDLKREAASRIGKSYYRPVCLAIDHLHAQGLLTVWQPIETALKDCCIDTIGTIQTHHGKKVKVRVTDDYMSSNSPYPLTTTYFEHPNGLTGTYTREAWMPVPKLPEETK